jgi:hypothetical protein
MADVLVLSPVTPIPACDGHRLAISSDISALRDNGKSVAVFFYTHHGQPTVPSLPWPFESARARQGGFTARLLRGLLGDLPPSTERYYHADAASALAKSVKRFRPRLIVIDDLILGGWLPLLRKLSDARIILRSHNVMTDVRSDHLNRSSLIIKPLLTIEAKRYAELERRSVQGTDAHWAITNQDLSRMRALYDHPNAFCLPVSLDLDRYAKLAACPASPHGFVHVGTIDYRRKRDLAVFLRGLWRAISRRSPQATLFLAGRVHGHAHLPEKVRILGPVAEDTDAYSLGQFSVHFQRSSAESNDVVRDLIQSPQQAQNIGRAGREWIESRHSRRKVATELAGLLAAH